MVTALRPRRASAPPCAATACFTRSTPCWASAGPDPIATPIAPTSRAADRDKACFMAIPPVFPIPLDQNPLAFRLLVALSAENRGSIPDQSPTPPGSCPEAAFFRKTLLRGILGSDLWRLQEEAVSGPATGHHLGVIPPPPEPTRIHPQGGGAAAGGAPLS